MSTTYENNNILATNNAKLFGDGKLLTQTTKSNWFTYLAPTVQLSVGYDYGNGPGFGWSGTIEELLYYPWQLSAVESQKVNSYLSIKWGITLDQTTPTNYLASNNDVIWDATANSGYKTDITVIGRDDCGALYQKQSTSTDDNDIISIGIGGIAVNNSSNANTITNDRAFLAWGHDNGVITNFSNTNMPSSLTSSAVCYQRIGRVWKSDASNFTNTLTVTAGKAGYYIFNKKLFKPVLMISNSATDWTAATTYNPTSIVNGIATYDGVTIGDGQYFTFAVINAAPGGITSNLNLWLSADDKASLNTNTDNTAVTSWLDSSIISMNATAFNGPLFRSGASSNGLNFNPTVFFDGADDFLDLPDGFANFTNGLTHFNINRFESTNNYSRLFDFGNGAPNNNMLLARVSTTQDISYQSFNSTTVSLLTNTNGIVNNQYQMWGLTVNAGTAGSLQPSALFNKGLSVVTGSNYINPNVTKTINYIARSNWAADTYFRGSIPEFILYNRTLNATELNKINSYLAIKYGFTLNASVTNYVDSAGNIVFDYSSYWNRITGISRDDCQALEQLQSKSTETGALVTVSNGSSIATDNASNANLFATNNSWLVFGDNNKAITWSGVDIPVTSENVRLNRVWRAKETGTVGTVFVQVPNSTSALSTKLPTINGGAIVNLLVANASTSGKFSSTSNVVEVPMTLNGTNWETTYDFQDGDYFTFSTTKMCLAPAGITDGFTTWYKTNELSNGTIAPTTGTLTDLAYGNHTLTRNGVGTATVAAGSATISNYNKTLTFAGNAELLKTSLNQDQVMKANAGSLFSVVSSFPFDNASSGGIFGLNQTGSTIRTGISGKPNFNGNESSFANAGISNTPNILAMRAQVGTGLQGIINGSFGGVNATLTNRPVRSDYVLSMNVVWNGGWNNSKFNEAFSYERRLEDFEINTIDSYLALKYGQTLSHNYYSPAFDGTNASTTTIYDVSTYNNRIFGVGRDDIGCMSQNQSTSQLTGSMLKISVDGVINAENSNDKTKFTKDRSYIIFGDDNTGITWVDGGGSNKSKPYLYSQSVCWDKRINRQWKVRTTNDTSLLLVSIPAATSSSTTKLETVPTSLTSNAFKVYMLINDSDDFGINANQTEIEMSFNPTTNEYQCNHLFDKDKTYYVTFVYKLNNCGKDCLITNPNMRIKNN